MHFRTAFNVKQLIKTKDCDYSFMNDSFTSWLFHFYFDGVVISVSELDKHILRMC